MTLPYKNYDTGSPGSPTLPMVLFYGGNIQHGTVDEMHTEYGIWNFGVCKV